MKNKKQIKTALGVISIIIGIIFFIWAQRLYYASYPELKQIIHAAFKAAWLQYVLGGIFLMSGVIACDLYSKK